MKVMMKASTLSQRTRRLGVAEAKGKAPKAGGAAFLRRVEILKQRHGGGVENFESPLLEFVPSEPFAQCQRSE